MGDVPGVPEMIKEIDELMDDIGNIYCHCCHRPFSDGPPMCGLSDHEHWYAVIEKKKKLKGENNGILFKRLRE